MLDPVDFDPVVFDPVDFVAVAMNFFATAGALNVIPVLSHLQAMGAMSTVRRPFEFLGDLGIIVKCDVPQL